MLLANESGDVRAVVSTARPRVSVAKSGLLLWPGIRREPFPEVVDVKAYDNHELSGDDETLACAVLCNQEAARCGSVPIDSGFHAASFPAACGLNLS